MPFAPPLALRVLAWRVRHVGAALLVLAAACLVARQLAPAPEPTRAVIVAASDLPAGRELTATDLRTVAVPTRLVGTDPPDPPDAASLVGRRVTLDVPAGLPLVPALLDDARFGLAPPDGTVTVPVRLADPAVAALLRPGDRVDLVAPRDVWSADDGRTGADGDGLPEGLGSASGAGGPADADATVLAATVLATAALVLGVPAQGDDDASADGLGGLTAQPDAEPLVVVAVAPEEGRRLAASTQGSVGAVLVQGS